MVGLCTTSELDQTIPGMQKFVFAMRTVQMTIGKNMETNIKING